MLLLHPYPSFTPHLHTLLPTIALVLPTGLCDSASLHPIILYLPLPVCCPLCPVVFPGAEAPVKLTGSEAFAFHFRGCSDLTCNSSDKFLSAMPMADSVVTLFTLISSEQISSSQRLAGSYRFLINVVTDFPDWDGAGDWGLGGNGGLRRERCWPEADAGRITSGL